MDLKKIKEIVDNNKKEIRNIYMYNILVNEEKIPLNIVNDNTKMSYIMEMIEKVYLENDYDLAFICGVANMYLTEILEENPDYNLENLCSETFIEMNR